MSTTTIFLGGMITGAFMAWLWSKRPSPFDGFEIDEDELNEAIRTNGIARLRDTLDFAENMETR